MRFLKWRFMTWVFLAFNALMLFWVIAGSMAASNSADCLPGDDLCEGANDLGTAIGVGFVMVLWFVGFVILGLLWIMTRSRRRACPVCGHAVKNGIVVCASCGHDFRNVSVLAMPAVVEPDQIKTGDPVVDFREQMRRSEAAKRSGRPGPEALATSAPSTAQQADDKVLEFSAGLPEIGSTAAPMPPAPSIRTTKDWGRSKVMGAGLLLLAFGIVAGYVGMFVYDKQTNEVSSIGIEAVETVPPAVIVEGEITVDNSNQDIEVVSCCSLNSATGRLEGEIKVTSSLARRGKYVIDLWILDADGESSGKTQLVSGFVDVDAVIRGKFSAKVVRREDAKVLRVENVERIEEGATVPADTTPESSDAAPITGPATSASVGTRSDPIPFGQAETVALGSLGTWEATVTGWNPDATAELKEANSFNEPPAAGFKHVLATVKVKYLSGTDQKTGVFGLNWKLVGSSNKSASTDECGVEPISSFSDVGDLFVGGEATYQRCSTLPEDEVATAILYLDPLFGSDPVFFAVQ